MWGHGRTAGVRGLERGLGRTADAEVNAGYGRFDLKEIRKILGAHPGARFDYESVLAEV